MPHSRSPTGGRGLSSVLYLNTAMPQRSQQYANFVSVPLPSIDLAIPQ